MNQALEQLMKPAMTGTIIEQRELEEKKEQVEGKKRVMTQELLEEYRIHLYQEEKQELTIQKYMRDLEKLFKFANGRELTKELVLDYKENLIHGEKKYKPSSINSFLVAANQFFQYLGWYNLRLKTLKIQKKVFQTEENSLSKEEYERMVEKAYDEDKERLALIVQTICATGIRISELALVTVESVKKGVMDIYSKGNVRQVLFPGQLQELLLDYTQKNQIISGVVFRTSTGNPVDRSNTWREMKALCKDTGIEESKVFPHNLRHLFAREFYAIKKDIAKLADVLGHSNIETTRIYISTPCVEHRRQLELKW